MNKLTQVITALAHPELEQWYREEFGLTTESFTHDNVSAYGLDGLGEVADQIIADAVERGVLPKEGELTPEATALMTEYVKFVLEECLGEGEDWPLGRKWLDAKGDRSALAAEIIETNDASCDPPYRVTGERGKLADKRLCAVADALGIA